VKCMAKSPPVTYVFSFVGVVGVIFQLNVWATSISFCLVSCFSML